LAFLLLYFAAKTKPFAMLKNFFLGCFYFFFLFLCLSFGASAQRAVVEGYLTKQKKKADSVQQLTKQQAAATKQYQAQLLAEQNAAQDTIKKLREELQKKAQQGTLQPLVKPTNTATAIDTLPTAPIDTVVFRNRLLQIKRPFALEAGGAATKRSEKQWSLAQGMSSQMPYKVQHLLQPNAFVFGWHPYWMGEAYKSYNFSLLSAVAYFSYELNPRTGGYFTIHDWETTALIDSAAKYKVSMLLTVTCLGYKNNEIFLKNKAAQRNLARQVIALLQKRKANGINLDFENIANSQRDLFTNFVIDLANELKKADSSYVLTLAVPALDFDQTFDFVQLNNAVAYYVVMGYEFYGKGSTKAGPIAPLHSGKLWWSYDLGQSIDNHLQAAMLQTKVYATKNMFFVLGYGHFALSFY
jgi:spore germination protein